MRCKFAAVKKELRQETKFMVEIGSFLHREPTQTETIS